MEIDEYIPRVYLRRIIKHRKKRFLYVLESEATIDIQDAEIVPRSSCNGKKLKGQMRWMDGNKVANHWPISKANGFGWSSLHAGRADFYTRQNIFSPSYLKFQQASANRYRERRVHQPTALYNGYLKF